MSAGLIRSDPSRESSSVLAHTGSRALRTGAAWTSQRSTSTGGSSDDDRRTMRIHPRGSAHSNSDPGTDADAMASHDGWSQ